MDLIRADGPECPRCGCQDAKKAGKVDHWKQRWQRWQCGHCGRRYTTRPEDPEAAGILAAAAQAARTVLWRPVRCPHCDSRKTKVTRTMDEYRYHKCRECGQNFRSKEEA